ncbi:hypothetical protein V8C37DRAFT_380443 [Trichoderma ceciliae]
MRAVHTDAPANRQPQHLPLHPVKTFLTLRIHRETRTMLACQAPSIRRSPQMTLHMQHCSNLPRQDDVL